MNVNSINAVYLIGSSNTNNRATLHVSFELLDNHANIINEQGLFIDFSIRIEELLLS